MTLTGHEATCPRCVDGICSAHRPPRVTAEHIVANWRLHFDADDDRPLINMIEASLLAAERRVATAEAAVDASVTVLPSDVFDELLRRLDEPPQPNERLIELMRSTRGRIRHR